MEQIFENIYRIAVPLPNNPLKELNSYFIKGRNGERNLLIDTGFRLPQCRAALKAGLEDLRVDMDRTDIFLTHNHADHTGLAPEFITENGKVYISEADKPFLDDIDFLSKSWEELALLNLENGFPKAVYEKMIKVNPSVAYAPVPGFPGYTAVREGDVLSVGGYQLHCLFTPGHTPGHMCLWDEESGIMFTGDCVLFDITPNITNWPTVEDSLGDYLSTLQRLKSYPVRHALPGHRKTGDFQGRVDELIKHHQNRLNEARGILEAKPDLTAYEITSYMHWSIRARNWEEFPDTQKFFAVGECLAHLDYLEKRGEVIRYRQGDCIRYRTC